MKGIILAGGDGKRLHPLTKVTNKHLLPIYNKPMIYYPLNTLLESGIKEIMLISGKGHAGHFLELLGSGHEFGCNITYEVQETSGGVAQALGLAERWADDKDVAVILGDNIFQDPPRSAIRDFSGKGAWLFLKEVPNPGRYGVPVFNDDRSILYVEEKPTIPKSHFAVTGFYLFDRKVFRFITGLKPSARGELEITDVINRYIAIDDIGYSTLTGYWSDAGTFDSLLSAGNMVGGSQK